MNSTERSLWHNQRVTLGDDVDLSGTKPFKASFNGKKFVFTRQQGWKKLYETIAKELYKINPKPLAECAASQIEFFISDEPVLCGYHAFGDAWNLKCERVAENYTDDWWTEIAENIYLYTKNSTVRKIEHLRQLFELYQIKFSALEIILY